MNTKYELGEIGSFLNLIIDIHISLSSLNLMKISPSMRESVNLQLKQILADKPHLANEAIDSRWTAKTVAECFCGEA